jgi:sirohydrochlorin cobaltochelatase
MNQQEFPHSADLLMLVGYGSPTPQPIDDFHELAPALVAHLHVPVVSAYLHGMPSVGESLQMAAVSQRPDYTIVLPLFVGATTAKIRNVQMIVDGANERGFEMVAHYGQPLGTHPALIAAYQERLLAAQPTVIDAAETALLVVGRGSRDAMSNAEVYQFARLLYEKTALSAVEIAFFTSTRPTIDSGIQRCVQTGARRIVIVPYTLHDQGLWADIHSSIQQQQARYPHVEMPVCAPVGTHPGVIEAISQRYQEARAELASQLSSDGRYIPRPHSHGVGGGHSHSAGVEHQLQTLLPPRYQVDSLVSAAPMGAAGLIFDAAGRVAWDQIWGDFCDLALAGGPPHRGTLLEPVAPETIQARPDAYQQVLAELQRGIQMITGLPVDKAASPGWIVVECSDEAMALWLLRAIVVENVSVRREGQLLYFPAGPDFRLEHEIKNIITVIAKTHHYWTEHITALQTKG